MPSECLALPRDRSVQFALSSAQSRVITGVLNKNTAASTWLTIDRIDRTAGMQGPARDVLTGINIPLGHSQRGSSVIRSVLGLRTHIYLAALCAAHIS